MENEYPFLLLFPYKNKFVDLKKKAVDLFLVNESQYNKV